MPIEIGPNLFELLKWVVIGGVIVGVARAFVALFAVASG